MKIKVNQSMVGATCLAALALIYGFVGYFARELAPGLSLWQQQYLRLFLAVPFFWMKFRGKLRISKCTLLIKSEPWLVLIRSLSLFVISVPLYFYATQHTKLGNAALLQILPSAFVLGAIVNKEKLTTVKTLLMLLSLSGAYLVGVKAGIDLSSFGKGETASLASGVLFSLGFVLAKKHKTGANDFEVSFVIMCLSALLLLIISLFLRDGSPQPDVVNLRFWVLLIVAGYLNSFMILLANYGFKRVKDTLAGNIMAFEGASGILFGYLIYKESPNVRELVGAAIITTSVMASVYFVGKGVENE